MRSPELGLPAGTQKLAVEGLYRVCWFSINNDNGGGGGAEQCASRQR